MEVVVRIHVERLPEGLFLATSEDVQGLVAQGRTVAEALEIARDVAKKMMEHRIGLESTPLLPKAAEQFDYSIVIGA